MKSKKESKASLKRKLKEVKAIAELPRAEAATDDEITTAVRTICTRIDALGECHYKNSAAINLRNTLQMIRMGEKLDALKAKELKS